MRDFWNGLDSGLDQKIQPEPWIQIECPLSCGGTIYVDKVNEDAIEESGVNPDFVEGDNWLHDQKQTDHSKYVPDHHIFLASWLWLVGWKKIVKVMSHEFAEVILENRGEPYEMAHSKANVIETDIGKEIHAEKEA